MPLRGLSIACALILAPLAARADVTSTFEGTGLAANSVNQNSGAAGAFAIDGNRYNNVYDASSDGSSYGWAISSRVGPGTGDYNTPFNSASGAGAGGSATYMVGFTYGTPASSQVGGDPNSAAYQSSNPFHPSDTSITLVPGMSARSIQINNTAYTYQSLRGGDLFDSAFGQGDFQLLDIRGYDAGGKQVGVVAFYLADYRSADSRQWTLVNQWTSVDLAALAGATTLQFGITSSRNDTFSGYGVLTPAYFAADNFVFGPAAAAVPEPSSLALAAAGVVLGWARRRRRAA